MGRGLDDAAGAYAMLTMPAKARLNLTPELARDGVIWAVNGTSDYRSIRTVSDLVPSL
ncbi:MAG TPA: hypothetical protein VKE49_13115 [Myxococcaceae bacterium]|nr:hypothetical protein [Myxococcaceae bacterium]